MGDRIKGLKLWHFGKLNFTYHGELWHRSRQPLIGEGGNLKIYIAAAVDNSQYTIDFFSLVYCGSYIFEGSVATVDKPQ